VGSTGEKANGTDSSQQNPSLCTLCGGILSEKIWNYIKLREDVPKYKVCIQGKFTKIKFN